VLERSSAGSVWGGALAELPAVVGSQLPAGSGQASLCVGDCLPKDG
jgi:hypothetical protein